MSNPDWTAIAGQIVSAGAPILGGVLGGPVGGVAGGVIGNLVSGALGVSPTPAAVSAAIAADTVGATAKLAPLDAAQGPIMTDFEAQVLDVQDARKQTISLAQSGSDIAWGAPIISVLIVAAFGLIAFWVVWNGVSDSQAALMILGALIAQNEKVGNYWLGSSRGSQVKDGTINNAVANAAAAIKGAVKR